MNFLFELYGENNVGKTHQAHAGWPAPLHVDTAFTSMGFRELDVDPDAEQQGESWPVVLKRYDWDEEEAREHYHYAATYGDLIDAVDVAVEGPYETIIFDNSHDMRVLAAKAWVEDHDTDWPQRQQWGEVNDMVDQVFQAALDDVHVLVVSQMTDEYKDGDKTGEREWDGPKRMPFKADFRVHLDIDGGDRNAEIVKNRFLDRAGSDWVASVGDDVTFEDLMLVSGIPEPMWLE